MQRSWNRNSQAVLSLIPGCSHTDREGCWGISLFLAPRRGEKEPLSGRWGAGIAAGMAVRGSQDGGGAEGKARAAVAMDTAWGPQRERHRGRLSGPALPGRKPGQPGTTGHSRGHPPARVGPGRCGKELPGWGSSAVLPGPSRSWQVTGRGVRVTITVIGLQLNT